MASELDKTFNAIFAGMGGTKHVLHLHTPSVNRYALQAAFLSERNGKTAYVTSQRPDSIHERFDFPGDSLSVIPPKKLDTIKHYKSVIIDAATVGRGEKTAEEKSRGISLKRPTIHKRKILGLSEILKTYTNHVKRENYLNELTHKPRILCTYDISLLDPATLKHLVRSHERMILTTDDTMVLSSKEFSSKNLKLNSEIVGQFVKNDLESIILAMVSSSSMCGNDIKKHIYEKFNILLSSGTIYPMLHKLQKQGLLKCAHGVKTKTYQVSDEKEIKKMLSESVQAKNFLSGFIRYHLHAGGGGGGDCSCLMASMSTATSQGQMRLAHLRQGALGAMRFIQFPSRICALSQARQR